MKRSSALLLSLAALLAAPSALAAPEGRFDAQVFRPLAAPRDLVMVPKSEVIGHMSPVVGLYWDVAFDPLALVIGGTGQALDVVGARLQITPLLGIGLWDWVELTAAIPLVAWQTSDNLRSIGTEGTVKSSPHLGDMRLQTKVALPFFNRQEEIKSGFGMAVAGNINLPTGDPLAFSSDGAISGGAQIIADYRFNIGLILATNLGVWIRPEHQFAGVKIGDMAQFGVAAEMYVVQRWGLSIIGEVYGYPSLTSFPTQTADQIPAEVLMGVRWQTRQGITITVGGSFGAACGFGAPAVRLFNSITWQPKSSVEQETINRLLERDALDPDHDGLVGEADKCPTIPGNPKNLGCPDQDSDKDGIVDREDDCPNEVAAGTGKKGCPLARIKGDEIMILDKVNFATDKDVILDESKPVLEAVARVLLDHPDIREVEIEGHTDIRAGDAYNWTLSERRVKSVREWLIAAGIEESRLHAKGYGHSQTIEDDTGCIGPDETLTPECKRKTSINRRVVFKIKRFGAPPPKPINPDGAGTVPTLPTLQPSLPSVKDHDLPSESLLPKATGGLPKQEDGGVLKKEKLLQDAAPILPKTSPTLPKSAPTLPKDGVLPKSESSLPKAGTSLPKR